PHNFYNNPRKNSGGLSDLISPISRRGGSTAQYIRSGSIAAESTPILNDPLGRRVRAHIEGTTSPPQPVRQDSNLSLPQLNATHFNRSQTSLLSFSPSPNPNDPNAETESQFGSPSPYPFPASPGFPNRQFSQDMISASTVAAGPSVQLVERMSAAVRRLESEVSGLREELNALSAQRDEARAEIVELMKDNEEKKEVEQQLKKVREEMDQLQERFTTTLEMLGEKEEMVDELRHDVADW